MKRKIFENQNGFILSENKNGNKNKNRNKRKRTFCENISIPLGIFSAQNNILFPTIKNSNCFISLLSDGNFSNFNGKKNSKNNESYDVDLNKIKSNNNLNNNLNSNSSNNDSSINRFLVFPVYHLSIDTILHLILSYNSTSSTSSQDHMPVSLRSWPTSKQAQRYVRDSDKILFIHYIHLFLHVY